MKLTNLTERYVFSPEAALAYGFFREPENESYTLQKPVGSGLLLTLSLSRDGDTATLTAYDPAFGEDYPLFEMESAGTFAAGLRECAAAWWQEVLAVCFGDRQVRPRLLAYVQTVFGTVPDCPFAGDRETVVLRCPNGKWYGIIMRVPFSRLGVTDSTPVDVLNIKLPPNEIPALIDGRSFFRCYHMNHLHWLSVALTEAVEWNMLTALVGESYHLVTGGKGKRT